MFWSKNNSTVAIRAGKIAANLAHTGKSKIGINQGRPLDVPNVFGIERQGKAANAGPCAKRAQFAIIVAAITPIVGAKFETVSLMDLLKYTDCLSFLRDVPSMNVVPAHINDRSALGKVVIEKVLAISLHASNTNMKEIRTLNISSVNRVRYLTLLEKLVVLETNKINEVQIPVQAYKGKKGKLSFLAECARVATNARTGPVEPIIVMG
jgi:hypothetical protein